jgi:hypothetical protein
MQLYNGYSEPGNLFDRNLFGMFSKTARDVFDQLSNLNVFHKCRLPVDDIAPKDPTIGGTPAICLGLVGIRSQAEDAQKKAAIGLCG